MFRESIKRKSTDTGYGHLSKDLFFFIQGLQYIELRSVIRFILAIAEIGLKRQEEPVIVWSNMSNKQIQ